MFHANLYPTYESAQEVLNTAWIAVKMSLAMAPPNSQTVAAAGTSNYKNNNKNKNKNNSNNNENANNKAGVKKKHLPDQQWYSMSKAEQDKHGAKHKAKVIAKAVAGG
jgi:nucleoside-specific outer membrane channel protein Tsx